MAVGYLYTRFFDSLVKGKVDVTNNVYVVLMDADYIPDQDAHQYESSLNLATTEVVGTGYTAGGQLLSGVTVTVDTANNRVIVDATDTVWDPSTITARYAVLIDKTPASAANNPLIGLIDFEADKSSSASEFKLVWSSNGIFRLSTT